MDNKKMVIVTLGRGVLLDMQKGGSALGLSPRLPKGGQRRREEVTPHGC